MPVITTAARPRCSHPTVGDWVAVPVRAVGRRRTLVGVGRLGVVLRLRSASWPSPSGCPCRAGPGRAWPPGCAAPRARPRPPRLPRCPARRTSRCSRPWAGMAPAALVVVGVDVGRDARDLGVVRRLRVGDGLVDLPQARVDVADLARVARRGCHSASAGSPAPRTAAGPVQPLLPSAGASSSPRTERTSLARASSCFLAPCQSVCVAEIDYVCTAKTLKSSRS